MGEGLLVIVLLAGGGLILGALTLVAMAMQRDRREPLAEALRLLEADDVRAGWSHIDATVHGIAVRWQVVTGDRRSQGRTLCAAALVQPPPFEMELRPQTAMELKQVRAGRAVDVIVGDAAFDDAFIVEAAPAELARALLDAPTRAGLLALRPNRVWVAKATLWLDVTGVVGDAPVARAILEHVVSMARRLTELPRALAEQHMADVRDMPATGYRGPTPEAMQASVWAPTADGEIAELLAARSRRAARRWTSLALGVAAWVALAFAMRHCNAR